MNTFLQSLSVESEYEDVIAGEAPTMTADEIILADKEEGTATDMIGHAEQARDIADDLSDIAERAEDLAEQDAVYAEASVESLAREFSTIMKAHKLQYAASSFESEIVTGKRAVGLAKDARRAAHDLRVKADTITDLSNEGWLTDLFKSKDKLIAEANNVIKAETGKLKARTKEFKEKGVALSHNGLRVFLTRGGNEITDFKKELETDAKWLESYVKAIKSDINVALKSNSKVADDYYKSIKSIFPWDGLGSSKFELLLDNKAAYTFPIIIHSDAVTKVLTRRLLAHTGSSAMVLVGAVTGNVPLVLAGVALTGVNISTTPSAMNHTDHKSVMGADDITVVASIGDKLASLATDNSWEQSLNELEQRVKQLKSEKADNYEWVKNAFEFYKSLLGDVKGISLYYLSNTAKLMESAAKGLK